MHPLLKKKLHDSDTNVKIVQSVDEMLCACVRTITSPCVLKCLEYLVESEMK